MLLAAPNGAVVDAREESVKNLLDAGFRPLQPVEKKKAQPKRRAARPKGE